MSAASASPSSGTLVPIPVLEQIGHRRVLVQADAVTLRAEQVEKRVERKDVASRGTSGHLAREHRRCPART